MATIQGVYVALFGRPADPTGLAYFNSVTNNGANLSAINNLAGTAEYQARFSGLNNIQIINSIYQSLFGRDADLAGLNFFSDALTKGTLNINNIAIAILDGAQGTDKTIVTNKVAAADLYTKSLDTGSEVVAYSGLAAAAQGRAFIEGVSTEVPTQAAVDAAIKAMVDVGTPGDSLTLTAAVGEQIVGTANDDSFSAVLDTGAAADSTFNIGDKIDGGAGKDTLNLTVANAAAAIPAGATVSNVEVVNLNLAAGAGFAAALNSSTFAGVQELWQIDNDTTSSFADVTVGAGVTVGFRSTGNVTTGAVLNDTVTAAAGVTSVAVALDGVADGSTLTVAETTANGLSSVTVSGSIATTAAVAAVAGIDANSDGDFTDPGDTAPVAAVPASNVLNLASNATDVDTLNLSISSNTTVSGIGAGNLDDLNKVDASGSTGNLTVDLGTPDELSSAIFGSGNDTVSVTTTALNAATTTLSIDLGAGNDVLTLNAGANANTNAVTITLGAGNDTLDIDTLANITATTAIDGDLVTVADFNAAQDVLNLATLGSRDVLVNTELANISSAATLQAALTVAASVTSAGQYSIFNYGGDAYIFANNGDAAFGGGDGLVKVTGFSVEQISATNLVV